MRLNLATIDTSREDAAAAIASLRARLSPRGEVVSAAGRQRTLEVFGAPLTPQQVVERICQDVRQQGLAAVREYTERLDGISLEPSEFRVSAKELAAAHASADPEFLAAVRGARENIREFQQAILHRDVELRRSGGVVLRQRYRGVRRAGLCVPGGAAAYPSTLLMTAVPAQVAGVTELAVVAPPTRFGSRNVDILATCHELGVREVYRVGGAQAVAALAYGVEGLPPVDVIAGPGNLFVALAKKYVFGEVNIDSLAGPSEVVVLADRSTPPAYAAADLLAQAEHAPGASILMTWEPAVLRAVAQSLHTQLSRLSRSDVTRQSLEDFAALILTRDADEACEVTDLIAPEHLHIATENASQLAERIDHAGAIFLGTWTPVALGDYLAGPSHVLPTGGTARWASGLTANHFLHTSSMIEFSRDALRQAAPDLQRLAEKEELTAHWQSVRIRLTDDATKA